jgi:small subunit ribosomal protein S17
MSDTTTSQQQGATTGAATASRLERRLGRVVSDKTDKTIKVRCDYLVKHELYGKFLRRRTQLLVHDEQNEAHLGDKVEIAPCRRLSKNKAWRLVRVVERMD